MNVLHGHGSPDETVASIALEVEILQGVIGDVGRQTVELQCGVRERLVAELLIDLVVVVVVDVDVATRPDELAQFQTALVCDHHRQQCVAGDIERHPEEHVTAPLVQLARQLAIDHVELEQGVARRQRRIRNILRIPGCNHVSARVRVLLDLLDHVGDLVDHPALALLPLAPLRSVDLPDVPVLGRELIVLEYTLGVGLDLLLPLVRVLDGNLLAGIDQPGLEGPLRPDGHTVLQKEADVGVPTQEPNQLDGHPLEVDLLRGEERKRFRQVIPDLAPEDTGCPGASTVVLVSTVGENIPKEVLVRCRDLCPDR